MQDGVLSGEGEDPAPTQLVKQRRAGPQLSHQNARSASFIEVQLAHVLRQLQADGGLAQLYVCVVGTRVCDLFQILVHYRLSQDSEYSSPCWYSRTLSLT